MQLGQKIKELRMMYGLTQEELADRAELSKGFISQLERDLTSPSIATLVDVLSCLGTDLAHFFSDLEPEQVVFKPDDMFTKIDEDAQKHHMLAGAQCPEKQDGAHRFDLAARRPFL